MDLYIVGRTLGVEMIFFASSIAASLLVFLAARPSRGEIALITTGAVILALVFGLPGASSVKMVLLMAYAGAFAFCSMIVVGICKPGSPKRFATLMAMMAGPAFTFGASVMLVILADFTPYTLDRYLYAADGSYGFQPGFWTARVLHDHNWLRWTSETAYLNLPIAVTALYLLVRNQSAAAAKRMMTRIIAVGVTGYSCYYFFPAAGSLFVFGKSFPLHPPPLSSIPLESIPVAFAPRNCMPSLHTAWALLIWWHARRLTARMRIAAGAFVFFTLAYTLASGHYLVDMVVAFPFTLAVYATFPEAFASMTLYRRLIVGTCAAVTVAWMLVLRYGAAMLLTAPAIPWTMSLVTIAVTLYFKHWLEGATCVPAAVAPGNTARLGREQSREVLGSIVPH